MALNKTTPAKSSSLKKKMMTEVSMQMTSTLTLLKDALGAKKFEKRVRKAAKLLTSGIKDPVPAPAKIPVKKAPLKKAPPKKPVTSAKKTAKAKPAKKR